MGVMMAAEMAVMMVCMMGVMMAEWTVLQWWDRM
jgi:hypothetical protein